MVVKLLYPVLLVIFLIFPKILCDVSSLGVLGYNYPQPPLIQFDEISTPSSVYIPQAPLIPPIFQDEDPIQPSPLPPLPLNTYLPPNIYPPVGTPPEIFNDEDSISITPVPTPGSLYQTPVAKMRVLNMSCILNNSFRSTIQIDGKASSQPFPVIEDGSPGCITATSSGTFVIDMEGNQRMSQCGVRRCALGTASRSNMCVVVRMPTIQGLKLPEDGLVTLQCTPQNSVVSHTKHLRLGPTSVSRGRSAATGMVATGGGQRSFNSNMVLLRKSPDSNNFDQPLQTGSVVLLGEEIALRANVQDGDGWKFSRMGPVIIRSSNSQRALTLVEENGCRSPGIRNICPFQPRQITPLSTVLQFRAFLFQDSARGDDMVLSVRMLGCLNARDCFQNGVCDGASLSPPLRTKRDVKNQNESIWESQLEFRVQMPSPEQPTVAKTTENGITLSKEVLIIGTILFLFSVALCICCAIQFRKKPPYY